MSVTKVTKKAWVWIYGALGLALVSGASLALADTKGAKVEAGVTNASATATANVAAPGEASEANPNACGTACAPMPGDQKVPAALLPPGAFDPDRGPSDVIFPLQNITVRFNHKKHMSMGLRCVSCHDGAPGSQRSEDLLLPKPSKCDQCHQTDHSDLSAVKPGPRGVPARVVANVASVTAATLANPNTNPNASAHSSDAGAAPSVASLAGEVAPGGVVGTGECGFCHMNYAGSGNTVARLEFPKPNMVFNHKKHLDRNIACQQCHGNVEELELATRDQLPRMRGCFGCHQMSDAARGDAKGACDTCHEKDVANGSSQLLPERRGLILGNRIKTTFASGTLTPPRWLHNAAHTADFMERHKMVAANDSEFCSNCHKEDFCTGCHDGRVRPRNIHPNDYIQMHPVEARMETQKCTSCHREQSFCLTCHQRLGITMSGPTDVRESGRFHPPKNIWSDAPRKPGHHAQEAMRNLNACTSCHVERDCITCHGGSGIGAGFNPHPAGFASGCNTQFKRNPRPCLACHEPGTSALEKCR